MNNELPAIRRALVSLPLIVIVVNALAVGAIDPLATVMIESHIRAQIDEVSAVFIARFLNAILPFILTSLASIWYYWPVFTSFWNGANDLSKMTVAARRLLDAPMITAALTGAGWLFGSPVIIFIGWIMGIDFLPGFYSQYLSHSFVLFGFSFVISYYGVETIVRRTLVNRLFTESEVLAVGSRFSLSIGARMIVFAMASFVIPGVMFIAAIMILNAGGDNNFGRDLFSILVWAIPILSLLVAFITWFKTLSIQSPITDLKVAAGRLGEGKFDERVTVRSSDELGVLGGAFNDMARGLQERERMRSIFGRVVDPRVRDYLLEHNASSLGEIRRATVVFFDLAGFTSLSETLPARKIVSILNLYFEAVSSCVEAEGGLVNKFIGDGVLAVFGVPAELSDHAERALKAIEALGRYIVRMNAKLKAKGYQALRFRAGVHTGEVLAGNVGSKSRQEYTVIGDAVNVASRLETLGKDYSAAVVVSKATLEASSGKRSMQRLGPAYIRGKQEKLEIYTFMIDHLGLTGDSP